MRKIRFISLLIILSGLIGIPLPQTVQALELFGPTVQIYSYTHLLNGQLSLESMGSGTIITESGKVLTNAHVIYNEDTEKPYDAFSICVSEGTNLPHCRFTATIQRYDKKIDLALLNIDLATVYGQRPTQFPFLTYLNTIQPGGGEEVSVRGFPSNGGATITTTKGQVSGFSEINGYQYIKTDADIDAGNSGGTALDANGNFIGVPSYVVSNYENSGRILHISEVQEWMQSEKGLTPTANTKAAQKLRNEWKRLFDASETGEISFQTDPGLSANIPDGWDIYSIADSGFTLNKSDNPSAIVSVLVGSNGFKIDLGPEEKQEIVQKIFGDNYSDQESISVAGKEAIHLWEDNNNGTINLIYFTHGYKDVIISYFIPKDESVSAKKGIDAFLNSLTLSSPDEDDPNPTHLLDKTSYPFSLKTPSEWRVITDDLTGYSLAYALRNTTKIEGLEVYYNAITPGEFDYTTENGLEYDKENFLPEGAEVIFESHELVLDGLPGWLYIYDLPGEFLDKKVLSLTVLDPEYELYFEFKAEKDDFDLLLKDFSTILKSFKSKRYNSAFNATWDDIFDPKKEVTYTIPLPIEIEDDSAASGSTEAGSELTDIKGHRFEENIRNLASLGIINGYPDKTFKPENFVNRAEALKIVLQSLRAKQEAEGAAVFVMPEGFKAFSDMSLNDWFATYVAEGLEKKIISGYPDGTFKGINTVNLAEALKMTLIAHQASIWEGETDPWYKKYFDAAQALSLLPSDLQDPGKLLTRAELAYIVDQLVKN